MCDFLLGVKRIADALDLFERHATLAIVVALHVREPS